MQSILLPLSDIYGTLHWLLLGRLEASRKIFQRKIFHYADVTAYGSFSVITTLEIFQHHFAKSGHGDLL